MIKLHRPELIVLLDDDREQMGYKPWTQWYFHTPSKIISGGQTGADQAGLAIAKELNIDTGGWMPKGFLTHRGQRPEFADLYKVQEHSSPKYPPRTFTNVRDSDATIRFANNFDSPGELLTLKAINQYGRPYIDVNINEPQHPNEVREWLRKHDINILNVAGNAERTAPGIFDFVYDYLSQVLCGKGEKQ